MALPLHCKRQHVGIAFSIDRDYSLSSLLFRVTWLLVLDVQRGTRGAARAGHGVAGPGLYVEDLVPAAACQ
jgi:hypothetical protein